MSSLQPRFAITALQELPKVLLAISADKDAQDIISRLRGHVRRLVCTERAPPSRCWTAVQLQAFCQEQGIPHEGRWSAEEALDLALTSLCHGASDLSSMPWLRALFSLQALERPLCCISIGTVTRHKAPVRVRPSSEVFSSSL